MHLDIRGRRKRRKPRRWMVSLYLCVCGVPRCFAGSLPGLLGTFGRVSVWYTWSRYLGTQLIHCLNREFDNSGRNWHTGSRHLGTQRIRFFLTVGRNPYVPVLNSYGAPYQERAVKGSREIDWERNGESGVLNRIATVLKLTAVWTCSSK
jgi:hypothetical protein